MVKFEGLDTPKGQGELNKHLEDKSYINGYTPSSSDVEVFKGVKSIDAGKFPHASRWFNHIKSFSDSERAAWTGASATTSASTEEKKEEEIDLFGDDEGKDDEWEKEIQKRADEHAAKKKAKMEAEGKAALIAKSCVTLDVKPWEAETDLAKMEELVRGIVMDGLEWKASKLVAIGYGVKKLQIMAHVEDEKVSVDDIQEKIAEFEDYVQSTDVVTFVKL